MNIYEVSYVENATLPGTQTMAVDSVSASDYEATEQFVFFYDDQHKTVAAYAVYRIVSILTKTSGVPVV